MKNYLVILLGVLFFTACKKDDLDNVAVNDKNKLVVQLYNRDFEGNESRSTSSRNECYDLVDFYIMNEDGTPHDGVIAEYNELTSEIVADGLHKGKYSLLVLAVRGDYSSDGATISKLNSVSDEWIRFSADRDVPLKSEYFYLKRDFEVKEVMTDNGMQEVADMPSSIELKRIVGCIDFSLVYNNQYVRTAAVRSDVTLAPAVYYTSFSADGKYLGRSQADIKPLVLDGSAVFYFMPTVKGDETAANVGKGNFVMQTRNYMGETILRNYEFDVVDVMPNYRTQVNLKITHPDDSRGTLFVTNKAYVESDPKLILQDDEPHSIYTNPNERSFSTVEPLQLSFKEMDNGKKFHARFYSPREITGVTVKLYEPSISQEYVDFAYFDSIPAFGDVNLDIPLLGKSAVFRTESGKQIKVNELTWEQLKNAKLKIESENPYWQKLAKIKYGYEAFFALYAGDPTLPNGGGNGKWKAIRPVHCREAVAFLINYSYMMGYPELEQLMYDNPDKLLDDNRNPVPPELVVAQMRQGYRLKVGLIDGSESVLGLGGPDGTYGVRQDRFTHHYDNYECAETMAHELGHVMGYGHKSDFTYGPWAWTLVNHFYVDHLHEFPVDSWKYLNSRNSKALYPTN